MSIRKKKKMCGTTEQGHAIRHSSSSPENVSPDARNNGATRNLSSDAVVNLDQYVCVYVSVFYSFIFVFEEKLCTYIKGSVIIEN